MTTSKPYKLSWLSRPSSNVRPAVAVLSVAVSLLLLIWSLSAYQPARNFYGSRAIYSLVLLSVGLALLGRILLLRLLILETTDAQAIHRPQRLREEWRPLFLFDITAPVYLAAAVLINTPAAVLTALITQMFLQAYTFFRGYVSWREASYRVATTASSFYSPARRIAGFLAPFTIVLYLTSLSITLQNPKNFSVPSWLP